MPSHRDRITITIRRDLLRALDATIDGERIRNRSHGLELVLSRALDTGPRQAVILASGQGVKLRPFTYEIPKPLIPVRNQPLLEYGISLLWRHGIRNISITVSHLAEKIEQHFGDGSKFNVSITYVREPHPSGTGGALRAARRRLASAPFIVLYSDVLLDLDLTEFLQAHHDTPAAIGTIALASVADPSAFGAVKLRGNRIVAFAEKPNAAAEVSRLVFAGCAVFNPAVFTYLRRARLPLSLEKDIFPQLIKHGRLYGYPFEGQWFDLSTPQVYERVLKEWQIK